MFSLGVSNIQKTQNVSGFTLTKDNYKVTGDLSESNENRSVDTAIIVWNNEE